MAKILENKPAEKEKQAYRLVELKEAMEASYDNLQKVIADQLKLLELVKAHDDEHRFDDFLKESEAQLAKLDGQQKELEHRIKVMERVVKMMYETNELNELTELLLEGLGVFSGK